MSEDVPPLALKPRRRMLQPTKDELRRQIRVRDARILALERDVAALSEVRPIRSFLRRQWLRFTTHQEPATDEREDFV